MSEVKSTINSKVLDKWEQHADSYERMLSRLIADAMVACGVAESNDIDVAMAKKIRTFVKGWLTQPFCSFGGRHALTSASKALDGARLGSDVFEDTFTRKTYSNRLALLYRDGDRIKVVVGQNSLVKVDSRLKHREQWHDQNGSPTVFVTSDGNISISPKVRTADYVSIWDGQSAEDKPAPANAVTAYLPHANITIVASDGKKRNATLIYTGEHIGKQFIYNRLQSKIFHKMTRPTWDNTIDSQE